MPRIVPENSCATCRRRKIKCDGGCPICQQCSKAQRECDRRPPSLKFVVHTANPRSAFEFDELTTPANTIRQWQNCPISTPSTVNEFEEGGIFEQSRPVLDLLSPSPSNHRAVENLEQASNLAACNPRVALQNSYISRLFAYYIDVLAPWYDLNDSLQIFGITVPSCSLDYPILFKALIAFAATHRHKISGESEDIAAAFHAACVTEFLESIEHVELESQGDYLAATCLLRSYEILNADTRKEQRHLLGAYSFVASDSINLADRGLVQAGAWNYLREEITVALECRRPVRISRDFQYQAHEDMPDDMHANYISYLLARTINIAFGTQTESISWESRILKWQWLEANLRIWKGRLPQTFEPYSTAHISGNVFPSLWMLRPWHVAARQYSYVAELLLALSRPLPSGGRHDIQAFQFIEELAQDHALKVCGLARTNENAAARVNAFGPLAFCGRFLQREEYQAGLESMLLEFGRTIGWPVACIIEDLKEVWTSNAAGDKMNLCQGILCYRDALAPIQQVGLGKK